MFLVNLIAIIIEGQLSGVLGNVYLFVGMMFNLLILYRAFLKNKDYPTLLSKIIMLLTAGISVAIAMRLLNII